MEKIVLGLSGKMPHYMILMLAIAVMIISTHAPSADAQEIGVMLDREIYPVPFGVPDDFASIDSEYTEGRSILTLHPLALDDKDKILDKNDRDRYEYITDGDLTIYISVTDPQFNTDPDGIEEITNVGDTRPVKITVLRESSAVTLGYAGGPAVQEGKIIVGNDSDSNARQFGPLTETGRNTGIFEIKIPVRFTDGPADANCSSMDTIDTGRFSQPAPAGTEYCIQSGYDIKVEYTSGETTVADTAEFDLRDAHLQTDKSVYTIGSSMIITLIEPDLDLDGGSAETYDLDLISWDSEAGEITMGRSSGGIETFNPEYAELRETGDSTGIFQDVIKIPEKILAQKFNRGEVIYLEYVDHSPDHEAYVGKEDVDINTAVETSNIGVTIELDKKVYTWTDKVHITVVAPDFNFDENVIDEIGRSSAFPLEISTIRGSLDRYKLVETGANTGNFTGEVTLTGFERNIPYDTHTDSTTDEYGNDMSIISPSATRSDGFGELGPTGGLLDAHNSDELTVSFEFSEDLHAHEFATIEWNTATVQWLEESYSAGSSGIIRINDTDMDYNPESTEIVHVDIWSDTDARGIFVIVEETGTDTGVFEATIKFTATDQSSDNVLRVSDGDTVAARYLEHTQPPPYSSHSKEYITDTTCINGSPDQACGTDLPASLRDKHIGMIEWSKAGYFANETAVIKVNDPDMNSNPTTIDNLHIDIWSSEDSGGVDIVAKETGVDTGVFEGQVQFITTQHSAGSTLRVSDNGTITAEYEDHTLPFPYLLDDEMDIQTDSCIGSYCADYSTTAPDNSEPSTATPVNSTAAPTNSTTPKTTNPAKDTPVNSTDPAPRTATKTQDEKEESKKDTTSEDESDKDDEKPKIKQQVIKPAGKEPEPAKAQEESKAPEPEPSPVKAPEPPPPKSPQVQSKAPEPKQLNVEKPSPPANVQKIGCGAGTVEVNGICQTVQGAGNTQNNPGFFDWIASLFGVFS